MINIQFTHKLIDDIPQLNLKKGTLLRQINPFAGYGSLDECLCLDENDIKEGRRTPWVFYPSSIDPLPEWELIRKEMIKEICEG